MAQCTHHHDCVLHDCAAEWSLHTQIDAPKVWALNEAIAGSAQNILKCWEERLDQTKVLESNDDDPELIIFIPFTCDVKIKGISIIGGADGSSPSKMRAFLNREDIDFADARDLTPVQEWDLTENLAGELEYPTKYAKFQGVASLTLHFPINFGGNSTRIYYIGLKGEVFKMIKTQVFKMETNDEPNDEPMLPEHSDSRPSNRVIREIDVYLTPRIDLDTKLHLLQYPLRPYWRPYNVEEKSVEVRVKPNHNKLEVDLVLDNDGPNYNADAESHLQTDRQTLTSSQGNLSTNYAIGILQDNKLVLNPIHAIVQLRPSLKYLDDAEVNRKKGIGRVESDDETTDAQPEPPKSEPVAFKVEVKKQETERQQQTRLLSYAHLKQLEEAEPWIALEPHGISSPLAEAVTKKMKDAGNSSIAFLMPRKEYLKKIVPGCPSPAPLTSAMLSKEPLSKSYLDTLPLDKRLLTVLAQGRVHVLPFERIMKLAPAGCTEEEVLVVLQKTALLVQGCWVSPSTMRYEGAITAIRDYILSLLVKSRTINRETLAELKVTKDVLREVLQPLAIQNVKSEAWEFIEGTDKTFIKKHGAIVKEQMQKWGQVEADIKAAALAVQKVLPGSRINMAVETSTATLPAATLLPKAPSSMSPETLAALPGALREIFLKHQVCTLQFIRQCLENLAIAKAQGDCNPRETAAAVAAAKAPVADLTAVINQVATCVNNVYFLTRLQDPALDPLREVVIALLRVKNQKDAGSAGLQRSEIMEASNKAFGNKALNGALNKPVYQKVMKELCYTRGATWVLKTGDGRPS